ncbi:hypothetical protein N656DRAFT_781061 [Canariomyces notabilis]|uniref:Uncharacterized protein n=1 Tax=Canariomyces notabilis TaxID=2074819 RepID=A0AAN6TBB9_9PEZI|nr:hypothetical protein N656DRAFT_781061 [Canariomyces arenarius]
MKSNKRQLVLPHTPPFHANSASQHLHTMGFLLLAVVHLSVEACDHRRGCHGSSSPGEGSKPAKSSQASHGTYGQIVISVVSLRLGTAADLERK